MARYLLLTDHHDGAALHKAHSVLERPDNWQGPTRAVPKLDSTGRHEFAVDRYGFRSQVFVDEPLFKRLPDHDQEVKA